MNSTFDYDIFLSLDDDTIASYMDPILNEVHNHHSQVLTSKTLEKMVADLSHLGNCHLVYGLELCAAQHPVEFALCLPQYLAHENVAVCCAAFNALNRLPDECLTADLIDATRTVLASRPVRSFVKDILRTLEARLASRRAED
jgi:hypothetical protein